MTLMQGIGNGQKAHFGTRHQSVGMADILKRPLPTTPLNRQPDAAEFVNAVSDFWYHTLWCAKHLRRGELWWAKSGIDMHLKGYLQRMLEWHARATRGDSHDTWLRGRFLEEWADPRAVAELNRAFAHYDAADMARALPRQPGPRP